MTKKRSIKKLLVFVLVLAVMLALAGCIRYETKMSVSADKKMNITLLYAEYSGMGSTDSKQDQVDKMKANGWSVVDYSDNDYSGWEMAKNNISFDDLEQELKDTEFGFSSFSLTEEDEVYTLSWDFSDSLKANSTKSSDLSTIGQLGGFMRFYISLPEPAIEHNATTVSAKGARLEWDLVKLDEPILVKFSLPDPNATPTTEPDKDTDPSEPDDTTAKPVDPTDDTAPSDSGKASKRKNTMTEEEAREAVLPFMKDMSMMTMQWIMIISWAVLIVLIIVIIVLIVLQVKTVKKYKPKDKAKTKAKAAAPAPAVPVQPVQPQQNSVYPSLPNPYGMGQNGQNQNGPKPPFAP